MHEFSIVQSLLDLIEKNVKLNDAKSVSKVVVKIGKLSGVEPHLLENSIQHLQRKNRCRKCRVFSRNTRCYRIL